MWLKKLKHQKRQLLLMGLMLFAVAGLLNMSMSLTGELASFSQKAINENNSPDGYIFSIGKSNINDLFINSAYTDEVESVSVLGGKTITAPIGYNGKDITQLYDMMLSADQWQAFGYLELRSENMNTAGPNQGEVWLSEVLTTPNNINIGDTIVIEYDPILELTVSGIYKTTCFPKGIGFSPILVHSADLALAQNPKDAALFAVNIKDYSDGHLKEIFQDSPYSAVVRSRDDVQASMMEYSASLSAIGAAASFMMLIVAMLLLWHIIKNNLLKEFRTIGVYKSLGYTSKDIIKFYGIGYMLVSAVSVTFGALASLSFVQLIGGVLTEYVDGFTISTTSFIISAVTIALLMAFLTTLLKFAFRKVKTITPVEAIAIGTTKIEKKLPKSILKHAKTPMSMAVNELFKYKKTSVMMILAISILMFLTLFFQMIWHSSDMILENKNLWFCLPKGDTYVTGTMDDHLQGYLNGNQVVKSAVYGDFMIGNCKPEGYPDAPNYIGYDAYTNFSTEITGVKMLEGHGPNNEQEVAVGKNLLKACQLDVGDSITLTLGNITKQYTISGTYETIANGGMKVMFTTSAVAESKEYTISRAYVQLNDVEDYNRFKNDVENKFTGVTVDTNWFAMENSVESIKGMLKSISMLLMIAFIAFSMLNIIIVLFTDMKNWRRKYGVLKSLGFTTNYMIKQNICKYFIIAVASAAFSLVLHLLLSQRLIAFLLIDAFVNSYVLIAIIQTCFVFLIVMTAFLMSLSLKKISPIELMEE